MDSLLEGLLKLLHDRKIQYDEQRIRNAYELAYKAHNGQKRESGEPYITHPVAVARILAEMDCDSDSVIAALLHDVIEDTDVLPAEIKKAFGNDVLELVEGVTKLSKLSYSTKEEQQVENLRKMLLAMAKDIRVILIKLADRLHNMRTLQYMPEKKRREKAHETMQIFAPLAHRLGIQRIKMELEDIALRYLDPVGYKEIEDHIKVISLKGEGVLESIKRRIGRRLHEQNIKYVIESRVKQVYSIYRKMYSQNRSFEEIYDLYAVRIIVDNVTECYNTLGIIHDMFKPIPGRFKDYISTPKPNMYQSLHTTVIGKEGIPFEVQIRTWEMHRTAEFGIAAHWKYKRGLFGKDPLDGKLEWVRHLLEVQGDMRDAEDFMHLLKIDLFADEVFVFTPKGDVINLPAGANIIDFAYAIHSAVGNKMVGAKVNGKIVELSYTVSNGEIVEILTSAASHGPSRDWLKIAKTNSAKSKIRQWYKKEKRDENIVNGREELEKEIRRNGMPVNTLMNEEVLPVVMKRFSIAELVELYNAIGYGGITVTKLLPKIKEEYQKLKLPQEEALIPKGQTQHSKSSGGVIVEGLDNCLVKFSQCCNPLPGDEITGFVTRGYGVSIHKKDCVNIVSLLKDSESYERIVNVHWDIDNTEWFSVTINVTAPNRIGLTADITAQLANMRVMIHRLNARETKDKMAVVQVTIDVKSLDHLDSVVARLKKIPGVMDIARGTY